MLKYIYNILGGLRMKKVQFTFEDDLHKYFKMSASSYEETMQELVVRMVELKSFNFMNEDNKQKVCDKFRKILNKEGFLSLEALVLFRVEDIEEDEENLLFKSYEEEVKELLGNIYLVTSGDFHRIDIVNDNFCLEDNKAIKRLYFEY